MIFFVVQCPSNGIHLVLCPSNMVRLVLSLSSGVFVVLCPSHMVCSVLCPSNTVCVVVCVSSGISVVMCLSIVIRVVPCPSRMAQEPMQGSGGCRSSLPAPSAPPPLGPHHISPDLTSEKPSWLFCPSQCWLGRRELPKRTSETSVSSGSFPFSGVHRVSKARCRVAAVSRGWNCSLGRPRDWETLPHGNPVASGWQRQGGNWLLESEASDVFF